MDLPGVAIFNQNVDLDEDTVILERGLVDDLGTGID